ncbi:origin recognition complex subunit 2 [Brienomyrus brachyistius]|uniref:origin recognition complex subunit 2 n=1 Tax=Brienomyrus brachyistius TaxID=42636 RepID=UPI0020B33794|nr:origin recognition complex subunit 2 [Brienomyrus brachyistius]XP_048887526.1 origin recognition complex subunit 2 [Brienomyrus brachyistius]XP_048887533.1 origin recognition complex subunit 2 [Brienomyrus brachyistius]
MSSRKRAMYSPALEVRFVGDADVLEHIIDKQEGVQLTKSSVQTLISLKNCKGQLDKVLVEQEDEQEIFNEEEYIKVLGTEAAGAGESTASPGGSFVFTFQTIKRPHKMAQIASEWAHVAKTVSSPKDHTSPSIGPTSERKTPSKGRQVQFTSSTPRRLRKLLSAPNLKSDTDSDFSASNSEEEEDEEGVDQAVVTDLEVKTPSKLVAGALYKTPVKKSKKGLESSLVGEYFEAHRSSKVMTSDRTLQRLQSPMLDQETLYRLLDGKPPYSDEIQQLNKEHENQFSKWILQLQLGFNLLFYGLGSKKLLLETFRTTMLQDTTHLVVNGFFPSITLKSILGSITEELLEHQGSFRSVMEQMDFIVQSLRQEPTLRIYLIIHNIDGPMLRAEKTQQALGQLASLPNMHLLASIDHINGPLVWDQSKMSLFNWLWYETTTFLPYVEETSYENSLLVQQSGVLALSSLTHVLRSLTPNARGIFRLLAGFQLENKNNPSYTGLSFQDFYQRCREAFLVNSDITLRTQLTEFRDHKLIRTKKGADGVEYLLIPVDSGTLTDFLEKEDAD